MQFSLLRIFALKGSCPVELTTIDVQDLTPKQYKHLYSLNFRNGSPMQKKFSAARRGEIQGYVTICHLLTRVVGWALTWYDPSSAKYPLPITYFYVRKSERGHGIGSQLLEKTYRFSDKTWGKRMGVWAWEKSAAEFFEQSGFDLMIYYSEE